MSTLVAAASCVALSSALGCTLDQDGDAPFSVSDGGELARDDPSDGGVDEPTEATSASRPAPRSPDARVVQWAEAAAAHAARDAGGDAESATDARPEPLESEGSSRARPRTDGDFVAKRCKPGTYTGSFDGALSFADLPVGEVRGTVRAELKVASGTDNLTLSGKILGADADGNRVSAHVTGLLDCATHQLVGARLEHGNYELPRTLLSNARPSQFNGTVSGVYSDNPPSLLGEWGTDTKPLTPLTPTESLLSGNGHFRLTLAPPNTPCDCD